MAPKPLTERNRDRLLALLADDRSDPSALSAQLGALGLQGEFDPFSAALALLATIHLPEAEAERVFVGLLRHRLELQRALRRDPGIRVAAADFLSSVEPRLPNPEFMEGSIGDGMVAGPHVGTVLETEVRRARRYRGGCALILVSLERCEELRESHGHLFADLVLEHAAGIVHRSIRECDIACRFRGMQLAVVLPGALRQGAAVVAERIRARVDARLASRRFRGHLLHLTVAGGIACHPQDAQTAETLVARALAALDLARDRGGGRVMSHHSERRAWPRRGVQPTLVSSVAGGENSAPSLVLAVNLSRTGALLRGGRGFRVADPVRLWLERDGPVVPGRVVRVDPEGAGAAATCIGVAFDLPLSEDLVLAAGSVL